MQYSILLGLRVGAVCIGYASDLYSPVEVMEAEGWTWSCPRQLVVDGAGDCQYQTCLPVTSVACYNLQLRKLPPSTSSWYSFTGL